MKAQARATILREAKAKTLDLWRNCSSTAVDSPIRKTVDCQGVLLKNFFDIERENRELYFPPQPLGCIFNKSGIPEGMGYGVYDFDPAMVNTLNYLIILAFFFLLEWVWLKVCGIISPAAKSTPPEGPSAQPQIDPTVKPKADLQSTPKQSEAPLCDVWVRDQNTPDQTAKLTAEPTLTARAASVEPVSLLNQPGPSTIPTTVPEPESEAETVQSERPHKRKRNTRYFRPQESH
ncbi:hypothetical protein TWF481_010476 [Arthrobotrys musiformis]|uniref:Uncharacterized protein n=1 Tax=Arthrobotrys musiformis TaxID=47236 RepID=A0AAV9W294_9PEZI